MQTTPRGPDAFISVREAASLEFNPNKKDDTINDYDIPSSVHQHLSPEKLP